MTDEQIKQNVHDYTYTNDHNWTWDDSGEGRVDISAEISDAYIAGAHSRDEEVGILEGLLKIKEHEIKQLRNTWISVEERLPEELQIVFVHMQGGSFDSAIYTNGAFERDLQLKFGMKDDGYTIISWQQKFKSNITHWMPIPEIPKGGEL